MLMKNGFWIPCFLSLRVAQAKKTTVPERRNGGNPLVNYEVRASKTHATWYRNTMTKYVITPEEIVRRIEAWQADNYFTGTMAVAIGNQTLYCQGNGVADHLLNTACAPDTIYDIASVTKQFSAAALLLALNSDLQSQLNKPLSDFLKPDDMLWEGHMPQWAEIITPHHLLTHTSGLVNYTDLDEFTAVYESDDPSILTLINLVKERPLSFQPGERFEYCNTGYFLIGQIIERLSGQSFSEYLSNMIFKPLQMTDTFLATTGNTLTLKEQFPRLARGYMFNQTNVQGPYKEIEKYWPRSIDQGDGGIMSTVADLLKWNAALYHGKLFSHEILKLMLKSYVKVQPDSVGEKPYYGYGLDIRQTEAGPVYSHSGNINGSKAYLAYLPALDLSIVSLSNVTFDMSSIKDERKAVRSEVAHIPDEVARQAAYNKLFAQRYPEIMEILKKHSLFRFNHLIEMR
jgi:CubicO group peptidase (beta-lactamase class C family)